MKYKLKLGLGTPPRHPYWLVSRLEAHVILVSASVQISLLGHDGLVVFMSVGTGRGIRTFGLELNNYHKSTKSNKKYLVFPPLRLKSLDLLHFPLLWPAFLRQLCDNFLSELRERSVSRVLLTEMKYETCKHFSERASQFPPPAMRPWSCWSFL